MPLCAAQRYRQCMTVDPRAALDRLVAALEAHYHAVSSRRGDDDPIVDDAYDVLADAFEVYDDALSAMYGETTPFDLADDDEDDDDRADDDRADDERADRDDDDHVPDEAFDDEYDDELTDGSSSLPQNAPAQH